MNLENTNQLIIAGGCVSVLLFVVVLIMYSRLLKYEMEYSNLEDKHERLERQLAQEREIHKRKDTTEEQYRKILANSWDNRGVCHSKNTFNNRVAGILYAYSYKYEMLGGNIDIDTTNDAINEINQLVAVTKITELDLNRDLLNLLKLICK